MNDLDDVEVNEINQVNQEYLTHDTGERLSPKEWAQRVYEQDEFVTLVWDRDKIRLSKRIKELMLLGYKPLSGTLVSHTVYEEFSRNNIPIKEDLCLLMINEYMYQNYTKRS